MSYDSDLESSLALLCHLDEVKSATIQGWLARNFCVDTHDDEDEVVLQEAMKHLIFGKSDRWDEYHSACLEAYYEAYPDVEEEASAPAAKKPKGGSVKRDDA